MFLARVKINRSRPFVIGVTGSVGKTSTKDAIYTVLSKKYKVLRTKKSYNTDFGLPLAILEQESGFSSAFKWIAIIFKAFVNAFFSRNNYQIFVVEMGVDKPGDMDKLLKLVKPQIAVMTNINPVHLAHGQFNSLEDIFNEKSKIVKSLPMQGIAVLNADDPFLIRLNESLKCRKLFYGTSENAEIRAFDIQQSLDGISFSVSYGNEVVDVKLDIIGKFQVYVLLPAIAVGVAHGFSLKESVDALSDYKLPPGRMNLIEGIKKSIIIDSSYNASPSAVKKAIDVLSGIDGRRRIAVIGNMNELGDFAEKKHREIGKYVAGKVDVLVAVGKNARFIVEEAVLNGFNRDNAFIFNNVEEASKFVYDFIKVDDVILVKGSQNNVRLEKLIKKIMKEPEKAKELLVRQSDGWASI